MLEKVIYLISEEYEQDELSQYISKEEKRKVYAKFSSVSSSEFFAAGQNGLKPECKITIFAFDYKGETKVEIDSRIYKVYRTYKGNTDEIELYLELN